GMVAGARNVISGNGGNGGADFGVLIRDKGTSGNVVAGNYIGTDATGTALLPNGAGVAIAGKATNNTVGGTVAGARNVISGNGGNAAAGFGVFIGDKGTSGNVVAGNYIGTDATGTAAFPNHVGVLVGGGATNNTVGGTVSGARNVISGNSSGSGVSSGLGTG